MITGVIDYHAGNLRSVETALKYLNADFLVSENPDRLADCGKIIFPGVGEASSAMNYLKKKGLDIFIKDFALSGKPILGICLGCQIILDWSEEGNTECLGLISGSVRKFPPLSGKVPQIGWNSVKTAGSSYLFNGIPDNSSFYFVHSYYPDVEEKYTVGKTEYGVVFSSAVTRDNISAVQFHPEKSGKHGLKLVENFIRGE